MAAHRDPRVNQLLAALPDADLQRWSPGLEWVDLPLGHVVYESGIALRHAFFPTSAIVSMLYVMENGASAEIAVMGREGLVGLSLFMGGGSTPAGQWFKAPAKAIGSMRRRSRMSSIIPLR